MKKSCFRVLSTDILKLTSVLEVLSSPPAAEQIELIGALRYLRAGGVGDPR